MNTNTTLSKGSWIQLNQPQAARVGKLLLLLLLTLPAAVQAQFTYTTNNGTIAITGYTGPGGAVDIPSTINGLPVTSIASQAFYYCVNLTSVAIPDSVISIGDWAFDGCSSMTSITIPDSVTSIGNWAFAGCSILTSVTIPDNVTTIGDGAFKGCTSLTSLTIGSSVTSIGNRAFTDCSSLTAITVSPQNPQYSNVAGVLFNHDQTTLMTYPGGKAGAYTIPNSVTGIGDSAFYDCTSLTSVTIPDSLTTIGDNAFLGCWRLTGVIIPNSVTNLGAEAFALSGLTTVTIPGSVISLNPDTFAICTNLTSVTIDNGVTTIGGEEFWGCTSLTSVTIGNSVTNIEGSAFESCYSLTSVYFQGNAPYIESDGFVFNGDNNATIYYLPSTTGWGPTFGGRPTALWPHSPPYEYYYTIINGTITLNEYIGSGGAVTIPDSLDGLPVTSIGENTFLRCSTLISVTIPDSVTNIGITAFFQCESLTSVEIPDSVTTIGDQAFAGCTSLTNLTLGSSVTSIGRSVFSQCTSLTAIIVNPQNTQYSSVAGVLFNKNQSTLIQCPGGKAGAYSIPNTVTSIETYAFRNCTGLTNVTIPNSVTSIGDDAFQVCTNLTSVTIPNSVTSIGYEAFYYCSGLTSVTIGNAVTNIGGGAFEHCYNLTSVAIGNSVTSIGDVAFAYCTRLTGVYFQGGAPSLGSSVFYGDNNATVYYLPGTTGWGTTFGGLPTAPSAPPIILSPPLPETAAVGCTGEFQVEVSGAGPFAYQWFFNATNFISGGTNAILQLADVQLSQSGVYSVVVSNAFGSVTSPPAMLTVTVAPVIVAPPTNQKTWIGGTAHFSVLAGGALPLVYQWFFGADAILWATNSTLQLTNIQPWQAGGYAVLVTNVYGAVTSTPAVLQVLPPGLVVTNCTEAALRTAMAGGGAVTFACDGTITLASTITIVTDTRLDASGRRITISGNGAVRVFSVNTNVSFSVANLTIAGGASRDNPAFGGAIYNSGTVMLDLCTLTGNSATGVNAAGGAIFNLGTLTVDRTTLCGNTASGANGTGYGGSGGEAKGAAICNLGSLWVSRSTFASNVVSGGDGGNGEDGGQGWDQLPPPTFGSMGGAGGDAWGGALFVGGPSSLVNCTLAGNQARGGPGGAGGGGASIYHSGSDSFTVYPGWSGGSGGAASGAVYDATGGLRLTNCTMAFNSSDGGLGGIGGMGNPDGSPGANGMAAGGLQTTNGISANCLLAGNSPTDCTGSLADAGHNLSSDNSCAFTNIGSMNNTDPKLGPLANNGGPTLTMALLPGSPAIDAGDTSLAPDTDQRGFPRPAGLAADIGAFEYGSVMQVIALSRSGANGLSILATGNAGRSCRLLSSTDLSSWVPIATNQVGSDGTLLFNVNFAPGSGCRFYRLVMP